MCFSRSPNARSDMSLFYPCKCTVRVQSLGIWLLAVCPVAGWLAGPQPPHCVLELLIYGLVRSPTGAGELLYCWNVLARLRW